MPKQIGFTRWYDRSPQVSQAVRSLEKADPDFQRSVAEVINEVTDVKSLNARTEGGLKKVGSQKILGLMKSKAKRRWYDENPQLHRAINNLYIMDELQREEIGLKVIVSLGALEQYKTRSLNDDVLPNYKEMLAITRSVFMKPTNVLMDMVVILKKSAEEAVQESVSKPAMQGKGVVESGNDGMRIRANGSQNTLL